MCGIFAVLSNQITDNIEFEKQNFIKVKIEDLKIPSSKK